MKTLCVQHGPVKRFRVNLNNGLALCQYSTCEEANKAQQALNNCILGNTTICAESLAESEVQNILHHMGVPQSQQSTTPTTVGGIGGGSQSWQSQTTQNANRTSGEFPIILKNE